MIEPTVRLFQEIERKRRELDYINSAQKAQAAAGQTAADIRGDLDDAELYIQERRFNDLYNTAAAVAGKSVRLAAIARQGMIQTEGGEHGAEKEN